jgi:hypothetical protein
MASVTPSPRSSPRPASASEGSKALKATFHHEKISPPEGRKISSVQALAKYLKECDPEITWLQTREEQNTFLQNARNAATKAMDRQPDGQYEKTWAKASLEKRTDAVKRFNKLEPKLAVFKDQWVAELFLGKCIKTKNVTRKTRNASESVDEGT